MKSYRLGCKARVDLREISLSIAKDSQQAALNWLKILNDRFTILARQPEMGERCDDLRTDSAGFPSETTSFTLSMNRGA